jgi:hypothetical protein
MKIFLFKNPFVDSARLLLILGMSYLTSCTKESDPVYPYEQSPYLELTEIRRYGNEKMEFLFNVWDREGDFGHDVEWYERPYEVIVDENDQLVTFRSVSQPPFYSVEVFVGFSGNKLVPFIEDMSKKKLWSLNDPRGEWDCMDYIIVEDFYGHTHPLDSFLVNWDTPYYNFIGNVLLNGISGYDFFGEEKCYPYDYPLKVPSGNFVEDHLVTVRRGKYRTEMIVIYRHSINVFMTLNLDVEHFFQARDSELNLSNKISTGAFKYSDIPDSNN